MTRSIGHLVYNAIRTPDGTVLISRTRHDYQEHLDKNGETYSVDGGLAYLRRASPQEEPYEELAVHTTDTHEEIREVFSWGTRGPEGDKPLTYVTLDRLTTIHILSIIDTQTHISIGVLMSLENELEYRAVNKLTIDTEDY